MGTEEGRGSHLDHHQSDMESIGSERTALSGPLKSEPKRSTRVNIPESSATSFCGGIGSSTSSSLESQDEAYVEITLDVHDDSVAIHSVQTAGGDEQEVPELTLLAKGLETKSSFGHRTKSAAAHALKEVKFISKTDDGPGWHTVEKRFEELTATMPDHLPRSLFGECIGMNWESMEFAEKLFDVLTQNRYIEGDSINKAQLKEFWDQISDQNFDSRLQTLFGDGRITVDEVKELISLCASANKLSNFQEKTDEYAAFIMKELDPDRHGYIMIQNLGTLLLQAQNQSRRGQKKRPTQGHNPFRRWYQNPDFLQDNWQRVWVIALWVGVMFGLFAYKFVEYRNKAAYEVMGHCVCMAKGAAETLKLNMALILLPVCRNTITWLRNKTKLGIIVPFDDNLNFHKVIAMGILIGVVVHALYHLACDFPRLIHASSDMYELMKPYFGEQPSNYWHFVKGVEGVTGIVMVVLMAIAFTLATRRFRRNFFNLPKPLKKVTGFNAFWYSHHLFIIVYTLLIVHGVCLYMTKEWYKKTTWMYLAVPLIIFSCERLIRAFRSSIKPVKILKVAIYPGNVLALHMSKPQGFKCKSGQYMFVKCADVSLFEWHPFHITSAPADDYLSVHIRTLGDWTRKIKTVFAQVCEPSTNRKSGVLLEAILQGKKPKIPRVLIDGPYGAPFQDYKKYEVVLLVGLGIGVAPMISVVKDILNNNKEVEEEENALENGNGIVSNDNNNFKTRRAYFYWVTREQSSFEWLKGVIEEVRELDRKGVIEMHNYCLRSVYDEEGNIASAFIAMLQYLNQAKNGVDSVISHFGRPSWSNVFKRIALNHSQTRVGVFYCGAPALTKELRQLALDFSHKTSTKFDFHKEYN